MRLFLSRPALPYPRLQLPHVHEPVPSRDRLADLRPATPGPVNYGVFRYAEHLRRPADGQQGGLPGLGRGLEAGQLFPDGLPDFFEGGDCCRHALREF